MESLSLPKTKYKHTFIELIIDVCTEWTLFSNRILAYVIRARDASRSLNNFQTMIKSNEMNFKLKQGKDTCVTNKNTITDRLF